jgi:hypothetical protein
VQTGSEFEFLLREARASPESAQNNPEVVTCRLAGLVHRHKGSLLMTIGLQTISLPIRVCTRFGTRHPFVWEDRVLTLIRCGITAAMLLSTSLPCAAQSVQANFWRDVFDQGVQDLEVFGRFNHININSPGELGQPDHCEVGAPDSVVLIGRSKYSRREGGHDWQPTFRASYLDNVLDGGEKRIAAPLRPDTLKVRIALTFCRDELNGLSLSFDSVPKSFVAESGGRYVLMDIPSLPQEGMIWFFAKSADGRLSELRWSPVLKRIEDVAHARARWKSKSWSAQAINCGLSGNLYIGMIPEMVREAWGNPKEINRTTTAYSSFEQWVYESGTYVYMTNGRLTAIQD